MPAPSVMWFRRDLRLDHLPALHAAVAAGGDVVGLFVVDPMFTGRAGAPRRAFLDAAVASLRASMDGALVVRTGDPVDVVPAVAEEVGAQTVFVSKDAGVYGRARDAAVSAALGGAGRRLRGVGSPYVVEPGTVRKADGAPYAVFTPFFKAWTAAGAPVPLDAPSGVSWAGLRSDELPEPPDPGADLPPASEAAARARWATFRDERLDDYAGARDLPGVAGTSRMSPYLKWGIAHPARLLAELGDTFAGSPAGPVGGRGGGGGSHRRFASELAWREFYADVLYHQPRTAWENLNRSMDAMAVDTDAAARQRFERWATGTTGFPLVDAGMRELAATGWMHNRVRMVVASFLVKDLHLPWQWGARHFMRRLVDGDLASNNHGWQWTAGTGTDAAPYFRVFNPTAQQERYDPDGSYVARWLPELGTDRYPAPMVDHKVEREEALARYKAASGR